MRERASVIFLMLLLFLPAIAFGQERTVNILYTGAMNGEIEPCGCSEKLDYGGLPRFSAYISENRAALSPYILLDAGNFMEEATAQGKLKGEAFLKAFAAMGYDAVALTEKEKELTPVKGVKALSDKSGGARSMVVRKGDVEANISMDPNGLKKGMLNILLSALPLEKVKLLEGWDVIILSSEKVEAPFKINDTVIAAGYPKGKRPGRLTLKIDGKGKIKDFTNEWIALPKGSPEDKAVKEVISWYDRESAKLLEAEAKKLKEGNYLGGDVCAECHAPHAEQWKTTRHSRAMATLGRVGKDKTPECVKCHTTGFGEEGGFFTTEKTPGLSNVQCEVCHGPGKDHAMAPSTQTRPISEAICLRCHTSGNSPDFEYKKYLDKVRH